MSIALSRILGTTFIRRMNMLEYCDLESRKKILGKIYEDYVKDMKKSVLNGIPDIHTIASWENFRYKWITENILDKLAEAKKNKKQG